MPGRQMLPGCPGYSPYWPSTSPGQPDGRVHGTPGCPECLPCRSQHRLRGHKAALACAGGGSILPGEMITATAQLQGTSRWPSAHPKSCASASSGNLPRAWLSRSPRGHADLPPGPRCCHGNSKLTCLGGSVDTCDLCVRRSVTSLLSACLPHPWRENSRGIPAGVEELRLKPARTSEASAAQRSSVTGPASHSPRFDLGGPDSSPRGSGRQELRAC